MDGDAQRGTMLEVQNVLGPSSSPTAATEPGLMRVPSESMLTHGMDSGGNGLPAGDAAVAEGEVHAIAEASNHLVTSYTSKKRYVAVTKTLVFSVRMSSCNKRMVGNICRDLVKIQSDIESLCSGLVCSFQICEGTAREVLQHYKKGGILGLVNCIFDQK